MVDFIDEQRLVYGVEPICKVLPIAPATYYAHRAQRRDPELRSVRAKRDERLKVEICRVWETNGDGVYGPTRCGDSSVVKASSSLAARSSG
jgi:hypothetical protein